MPYNKQVNPYGIASSELDWRGFADGGRNTNPGGVTPTKSTLVSDAALLGMSAALDGSGEWFGPSITGEKVGEKAMAGNKLARDAMLNARDVGRFTPSIAGGIPYDYSEEDKIQLSRDFAQLQAHQANIEASKDYGKDIYRNGLGSSQKVPKTGVLGQNINNPYEETREPFSHFDDFTSRLRKGVRWEDTKKKLSKGYNEAGSWFNRFSKD